MSKRIPLLIAVCLVCILPGRAQAQETEEKDSHRAAVAATDRLFLSFGEEAALVDRQWWEGQVELQDGNGVDATILRGVVAFQPWENIEVGGRVGFGDTRTPGRAFDGSGATDLDAWAKYHFGTGERTEYAAGATLTVPTGDDSVGLGFDAFSAGAFGSLRHSTDRFDITGNVGIRFNGDGRRFGFNRDGETSVTLAAGILVPISERLTFVGEGRFETNRFVGMDSDTRALGGINFRVKHGGLLRAAVALGLTNGAPDSQLIVGYASTF